MKTYTCIIHEKTAFSVVVEADTEDEAKDAAEAAHHRGESVCDGLVGSECAYATEGT